MALLHYHAQRDLAGLRTIATLAPWLGILATCVEIIGCFKGIIGDVRDESWRFIMVGSLGDACVCVALGGAIGVATAWVRDWIEHAAAELDLETRRGWAELRVLTR
jgi:biopolymer transport protein ExbB/TolQ